MRTTGPNKVSVYDGNGPKEVTIEERSVNDVYLKAIRSQILLKVGVSVIELKGRLGEEQNRILWKPVYK